MKDSTVKLIGFAVMYLLFNAQVCNLYGISVAVMASLGVICLFIGVSAIVSDQSEKREAAQKQDAG